MTTREQFEAHYPIPAGVEWSDKEQRYQPVRVPWFSLTRYESYVEAWVVWQASRAALVVELPEVFEKRDVQGLDYDRTVAAISAAGVRVKP